MKKYILIGIALLFVLGVVYTYTRQHLQKFNTGSVKKITEDKTQGGLYRTALFAGGCFWSLESYFEKIPDGIVDVVSGYSGGTSENPSYDNYTMGNHREVVQVTYDPAKISYGELTEYFFRHIDPTDAGGSFYDRGMNYTSAIYYDNQEEKKVAVGVISIIDKAKIFEKPIVTDVLRKLKFWPAEEYHQNYARDNSLRYAAYRVGSGRDAFLKKTWEGKESNLYKE